MSKLQFKMDDFGVHESVSYEMRDRIAKIAQDKFNAWFEENYKNRLIGQYKIAPFGDKDYAIYFKNQSRVTVPKERLEKVIDALFKEVSGLETDSFVESQKPNAKNI